MDAIELTPDQQKRVLLVQRQILTAQVNIHNNQKKIEQLGPVMNDVLTQIAQELKIDPEKVTFDLDNLRLTPKIMQQEAQLEYEEIGRTV